MIRNIAFGILLIALPAVAAPAEEAAPAAEAPAVTAPPPPAAVPGPISKKLSPADIAKVKKGEIILRSKTAEDTSSGAGFAVGLINKSPDDIWKTILNYDNYAEFMPRVETCKTTLKQGNRIDSYYELDMGLTDIEYTLIHYINRDKNRLTWKLDDTKPRDYVTKTTGYWQLEPLAQGGTLIEYNVEVDVHIPVIGWLIRGLIRKLTNDDLPNVIGTMKKRVESGNTWKK